MTSSVARSMTLIFSVAQSFRPVVGDCTTLQFIRGLTSWLCIERLLATAAVTEVIKVTAETAVAVTLCKVRF